MKVKQQINNIVVIGASTVYGEGDPEGGGFVTRLKAWHEQGNPRQHRVFNLGIAAERIVKIVNRFDSEVRIRKPDLIIYYPGLNDFMRIGSAEARTRSDFEQVSSSLKQICEACRDLCPLIIMTPIPPNELLTQPFLEKFYFLHSDAARLSELVKSLAKGGFCHVFNLFDSWLKDDKLKVNELLFDGLHCNAGGHQRIFEELSEYLGRGNLVS